MRETKQFRDCVNGGEKAAEEFDVQFLGRVPLDQKIVEIDDLGKLFISEYPSSPAAEPSDKIVSV